MSIYNVNIPDTPNAPSNDQPLMKANFRIANDTMGTNHVPMTDDGGLPAGSNRGKHNMVTLVQQAVIPLTPGAAKSEGLIWAAKDSANTVTAPFYSLYNGTTRNTFSMPIVKYAPQVAWSGSGTTDVANFLTLAYPPMTGMLFLYDSSQRNRTIFTTFIWDGTSIIVPGSGSSTGQLIGDTATWKYVTSTGSKLQLVTGSGSGTIVTNIWGSIT